MCFKCIAQKYNKVVKYVPLRSTGLTTLRFVSRLPRRYMYFAQTLV